MSSGQRGKVRCWCERSEETGHTGSSWISEATARGTLREGGCSSRNTLGNPGTREERESEATIHTDGLKLENMRLTNVAWSEASLSCDMQMVASESGLTNMKRWIHPSCIPAA